MKAKEWYSKMKNASTKEEFETVLVKCLESLCDDADKLIKIRHATSDHAVANCINEVNDKWKSIVNSFESDKNNGVFKEGHPFYDSVLHVDGFKAAYVHLHPKRGWYFDMKIHKQNIETAEFFMSVKNLYKPVLILYGLTPYDKLENNVNILRHEFLHTAYALGSTSKQNGDVFTDSVIKTYMKILAIHMTLLKLWIQTGNIDIEDIDIAYTDHDKLIEKYQKKGVYVW